MDQNSKAEEIVRCVLSYYHLGLECLEEVWFGLVRCVFAKDFTLLECRGRNCETWMLYNTTYVHVYYLQKCMLLSKIVVSPFDACVTAIKIKINIENTSNSSGGVLVHGIPMPSKLYSKQSLPSHPPQHIPTVSQSLWLKSHSFVIIRTPAMLQWICPAHATLHQTGGGT